MIFSLVVLVVFLLLLLLAISYAKLHPFVALLLTAVGLGISLGLGGVATLDLVLTGFSETLRWIAVIIILGALIGEVLQETGGAFRIADRVVAGVGLKRLPWAMGLTGYIVSIPVFVDVAYILLQPLVENLAVRARRPVLFLGLALTAGLTVAHTLLPPTPGPLAVASLLGVDLAEMMLVNALVGGAAVTGGILFVQWKVKDTWLQYDKKLAARHSESPRPEVVTVSFRQLIYDLAPIVLPIILIAGGGVLKTTAGRTGAALTFLAQPLIAVSLGVLVAVATLGRRTQSDLTSLVDRAIVKSALVIMITGAGGALGHVIRAADVQQSILELFSAWPSFGVFLPFLLAALLTTATGSITVSLVGTASMIGPMAGMLPLSPVLVAAAIGSGAFCVFHANASFFWLLNRLHEVPPPVLYRTYTVQSFVMGVAGFGAVLLLHLLGV